MAECIIKILSLSDRVFGVGGSNGAISGSIISKTATDGHLGTPLHQLGFLVAVCGKSYPSKEKIHDKAVYDSWSGDTDRCSL